MFPVSDGHFQHVYFNVVGPLPANQGYTYVLTMIDQFTRWPEASPIQDITTITIAKTFITTWLSRYGTLATVTTDLGSQFESELWKKLKILLDRTTEHHPSVNGMVECLHRQLKEALTALSCICQWMPLALLHIRTTFKQDLQCTAAEMVYGTNHNPPCGLPSELRKPGPGSTRKTSQPHG